MTPEGNLATIFLELLKATGIPVVIVVAIGTLMALYQFAMNLNDQANAIQQGVISAFAASSRRKRAYALFVASHVAATAMTISVVWVISSHPRISEHVEVGTTPVLAGIAAYFLAIDWWSLRHGDALPHFLGSFVAVVGGFLVCVFGVFRAVEDGNWQPLLLWAAVAFFWAWSVGWASATGSGLARAIQQA